MAITIKVHLMNESAYKKTEGEARSSWVELPMDPTDLQQKLDELSGPEGQATFVGEWDRRNRVGGCEAHDDMMRLNELMTQAQTVLAKFSDEELEALDKAFLVVSVDDFENFLKAIKNGQYDLRYVNGFEDLVEQLNDEGLLPERFSDLALSYLDVHRFFDEVLAPAGWDYDSPHDRIAVQRKDILAG